LYNLSVNFIFYGISCENYRSELIKILKCDYIMLKFNENDKIKNVLKNNNDTSKVNYQVIKMKMIKNYQAK
jgi:hypothetical protein